MPPSEQAHEERIPMRVGSVFVCALGVLLDPFTRGLVLYAQVPFAILFLLDLGSLLVLFLLLGLYAFRLFFANALLRMHDRR